MAGEITKTILFRAMWVKVCHEAKFPQLTSLRAPLRVLGEPGILFLTVQLTGYHLIVSPAMGSLGLGLKKCQPHFHGVALLTVI